MNIDELSTDNAYIQISKSITDTAQHILEKYRLRKQPWITVEILEVCDNRRSLKAKKHKSNEHAEEYRIVHSLIRRSMKYKKDEWLKSQCNHIDYELKIGVHGKRAYNTIKAITNPTNRYISNIEDANGIPLEDDTAKLQRFI